MSKSLQISSAEILERLILSCQIPSVVKEIVRHQIIDRAVQAEGIVVSDRELQQAADQFRVKYDLYDPQTTWHWLNKNHLTGDDFEKLIYESIVSAKLVRHLFDDRVEAFFYERQLDYTQAVLYEVLFTDFDTAIEVFYAIEEQEISFVEVARQYIQEPDLRRRYGYRGTISRKAINSAISAAVFAATPPQVLKPIAIGQNIHLILVEEIIEPQLDKQLRGQILTELFAAWLEKQLLQYSIEIESELRQVPSQAEISSS